jgi:hypothetical protein
MLRLDDVNNQTIALKLIKGEMVSYTTNRRYCSENSNVVTLAPFMLPQNAPAP